MKNKAVCRKGHDIPLDRVGKKNACLVCNKIRCDKWRKSHPETVKAANHRNYHADPARHNALVREWREANKEKHLQCVRSWQQRNPWARKFYENKRRAAKLRAIVPWSDLAAIKKIYENCPPGYHVDHIFPLQGKEVCGLHVVNNLQYLPASENSRKGNRLVTS